MGPLRLAGLVLAVALAAPAVAASDPVERWSDYVAEASIRFGIPQAWIRRVMRAESGGHTMRDGRPITSTAGAQGLMQLMPGTWQAMRIAHGLGQNVNDPRDNILAGAAYLRAMYDRFGHPGLFAAYNAGPARYADHLATGRRLPAETVAYVAAVGGATAEQSAEAAIAPRGSGIFVMLGRPHPADVDTAPPPAAAGSLFVRLSAAPAPSR
jgi:soluble lytic murein transglycosylase-like protein